MKSEWSLSDLDPRKLFEVRYNRDPETSSRFVLPIANWLDADGNPKFNHPAIKEIDKNGKLENRFTFQNYEDGCQQCAKIDGTGVIIFTAPTPGQTAKLKEAINSYTDNPLDLAPDQVKAVLSYAYNELGLLDRYHGNQSDIRSDMDCLEEKSREGVLYGSFVYKPSIVSTALYLSGKGRFLGGPTATPQIFEDGGFVLFSKKRLKQAEAIIKNADPDEPYQKSNAKIVSKAAFLKSRRDLNDKPFNMGEIRSQDKQLKKIYKPNPISGFAEWSPEIRNVEKKWLKTIEETFELYGYTNIETPAVEELPVLIAKGEDVDKQIYTVSNIKSDASSNEKRLGLHYDLTVPMARYVAQHFSELSFPFKRYQIQKVWRGEGAQKGRYREFYQCDIDVVDQDNLSLEFDAEFPVILSKMMKKLDIGNVTIGVNNRKILEGFYQGLGLDDDEIVQAIRIIDKIDKQDPDQIRDSLSEKLRLNNEYIGKAMVLASFRDTSSDISKKVLELGVDTPLLREGLKELDFVMERVNSLPEGTISKGSVVADLSIARGFDYYTGTVYEGKFSDYPGYPTILGGGRYDNLVGKFMNKSLPGVGISFGLTRIFSHLVQEGRIQPGEKTPTQVLVALADESARDMAREAADSLRERGIRAEVYHEPKKYDRQLSYANKKRIPYVVFPHENDALTEVRDMNRHEQKVTPLKTWTPNG